VSLRYDAVVGGTLAEIEWMPDDEGPGGVRDALSQVPDK
jgi:hypothetical protein